MTTSSWSRPARSPSSMRSSTSRKTSSSRSRRRPSASASGSSRRTIGRRPPGPPGWQTRHEGAPHSLMAEDIMSAWERSGEPADLRRKFDDDEDEFEDDGFTFDDDDEDEDDRAEEGGP